MTEEIHLAHDHITQKLIGMDMKRGSTSQQAKGRNHAYQAKAMVAMHVRDKNMANLCKTHMTTAKLHLCTLAAIYHKQFLTYLYNLGGREMTKGGQRTATPKYMYSERFHEIHYILKSSNAESSNWISTE